MSKLVALHVLALADHVARLNIELHRAQIERDAKDIAAKEAHEHWWKLREAAGEAEVALTNYVREMSK